MLKGAWPRGGQLSLQKTTKKLQNHNHAQYVKNPVYYHVLPCTLQQTGTIYFWSRALMALFNNKRFVNRLSSASRHCARAVRAACDERSTPRTWRNPIQIHCLNSKKKKKRFSKNKRSDRLLIHWLIIIRLLLYYLIAFFVINVFFFPLWWENLVRLLCKRPPPPPVHDICIRRWRVPSLRSQR